MNILREESFRAGETQYLFTNNINPPIIGGIKLQLYYKSEHVPLKPWMQTDESTNALRQLG